MNINMLIGDHKLDRILIKYLILIFSSKILRRPNSFDGTGAMKNRAK